MAEPGTAVLQLIAPAPVGGLERVVVDLVAGLVGRGCRVGVAALDVGDGAGHPVLERLRAVGATIAPIAAGARGYGGKRAAIGQLLREGRWPILHSHGYQADVLARLAGGGAARVSTVHGFTEGGLKNRCYEALDRIALRGFDGIAAVSRPIEARLRRWGVPADRIAVLPNALRDGAAPLSREAARARLGLREGEFAVGWVGRLSFEKGPDLLVDAMSRLRVPGAIAVIVGDGPMKADLSERARGGPAAGRIRWAGPIDDAAALMTGFDVLTLSSRTEGTPIVLLEALRAGTPVVATAVGGVPDVLGPEEGLLVPPEAGDLARALEAVAGGPGAAAERARRGQARLARDFDYQRWLDGYQLLYRTAEGR